MWERADPSLRVSLATDGSDITSRLARNRRSNATGPPICRLRSGGSMLKPPTPGAIPRQAEARPPGASGVTASRKAARARDTSASSSVPRCCDCALASVSAHVSRSSELFELIVSPRSFAGLHPRNSRAAAVSGAGRTFSPLSLSPASRVPNASASPARFVLSPLAKKLRFVATLPSKLLR